MCTEEKLLPHSYSSTFLLDLFQVDFSLFTIEVEEHILTGLLKSSRSKAEATGFTKEHK